MTRTWLSRAVLAGAVLWCPLAWAADPTMGRIDQEPEPPARQDTALQVTPYLWASGLRGDVAPFRRGPTIPVDKSFGDILQDLRLGGFVHVWQRSGPIVFSADAMLVDTREKHAIERVPVLGPVRGLSATVDTRNVNASLQAGYRIVDEGPFRLDALAGIRMWSVSNKVAVNYGPFTLSHGETFGWIDPVIGLRAFYGLTDRLSIQAQGDIGGFGAASRLTWQVLGTANYLLTDHLSVSAGYKILESDYRSGGHVFKGTLSGPVAGLTYRF